jgi:hypothetical protein
MDYVCFAPPDAGAVGEPPLRQQARLQAQTGYDPRTPPRMRGDVQRADGGGTVSGP